ncbi:TPA: hypothetical protein ACH3X2_013910, partial [Trebouxia sp. C0005]
MPKLDQTFFNRCFYAVSFGTGNRAQQFNRASDPWPSLATTHETLYTQSLPANHQRPERPTSVKHMLNAAALKARVDLDNHVATNFFTRSRCWIRLQLEHKLDGSIACDRRT